MVKLEHIYLDYNKRIWSFPGLLISLLLFIWSLKFFNGSKIKFFKIKFLSIIFIIFFSSLGGSYFETHLIQNLNLDFSIISQNGLSEWFS